MRTIALLCVLALVLCLPSFAQAGDCFAGQSVAFSTGGFAQYPVAFNAFAVPRVAFNPFVGRAVFAPRVAFVPRRDVFFTTPGRVFVPVQRGLFRPRLVGFSF